MHTLRVRSPLLHRLLLPLVMVALPLVLLLTSLRTLRELDEQRAVYLRSRVAVVAGSLETMTGVGDAVEVFGVLSEVEPALYDLELIDKDKPAGRNPALEPLWTGNELFRTGFAGDNGNRVFRAWVPFHSGGELKIARIDLDPSAADFLMVHARRNVAASSAGGLVVVTLALYAIWMARREARFRVRQLELEQLARVGKMSAVLAHEIRNPLGTIKGFAQLLGERQDAEARRLLEPILSETGRLENLVNDLLLYGRPPVPAPRQAPWQETADAIADHARHLIGARDIRFSADRPAIAWQTDPQLLRQALLNLVRNAVESAAESGCGEVRVEVRLNKGPGVAVAVVDNGPGMSQEARRRLFEPFFTTKAFGTGLGLSITRNLAESLGGELTIGPRPGGGTEAVVRFSKTRATQVGQQ